LRDLADEIVQETWMTAVRRIRRFAPEQGPFLGWLRGIAANLLRNHLRREDRRSRLLLAQNQDVPVSAPVDSDLERRERARHIARVLAGLKDRYEAVLRARYLEGRSVADIAAAWRETPKAIESLLTRAREAFRSAYGPPE
jgi:RNA polymerase sigma-70 factor (ECF subfamily)